MNLLENLNISLEKKLNNDKLISLRGGDPPVECCLWCFGEIMYCSPSGTGSCDGMVNPDPDNCEVKPA